MFIPLGFLHHVTPITAGERVVAKASVHCPPGMVAARLLVPPPPPTARPTGWRD